MFSFDDYREIIRIIKSTGRGCNSYREALGKDDFILMRHDVEYSVKRAYDIAKVETSMDFRSTFFFQWTNNSYNLLSKRNQDMIRDMHERGQNIGLHFALNGLTDIDLIKAQIKKEIDLLSNMLDMEITEFSIHRPSPDVLRANIKFPGIINAYQDDFFTFNENTTDESKLEVKYMSDANHIWRYGYPTEDNIKGNKKVQILVHPFGWTKQGYDNYDNYRSLVREKYEEMIDSIDKECKDFGEYRDGFIDGVTLK
ncbi:MAG: hypothetical protein K5888_10125 [Lachnospiraceae bacterium]|nr:hypothetical protein [Lachnospiraceae bacterium]